MTFIFKYALLQLLVQERVAVHVQEAHRTEKTHKTDDRKTTQIRP